MNKLKRPNGGGTSGRKEEASEIGGQEGSQEDPERRQEVGRDEADDHKLLMKVAGQVTASAQV